MSSNPTPDRKQAMIDTKKAAVLDSRKRRLPVPLLVAAVLTVALAALATKTLIGSKPAAVTVTPAASSTAAPAVVRYPLHLFDDGHARHFEYESDDITVRYFILKSSDGVVRAAFDACDVCWPEGKGYVQDGNAMMCRNCGRRFDSVLINQVKGGCNPAPLERHVSGDQLVIRVDDIRKGEAYFDFAGKG